MHKLLLADDSVTIQRVIELTFAGEDIQVVAVGDGEQAIARIQTERPDIVLADIGMPKRSGYEVAAFVKSQPALAHIPVLLLAGAFEPVDEARAEQVKCDGVLVKPFEPQQVIARVRELVDGAKGTPAHATAGVPRPVDRLTPRTAAPEARFTQPPTPQPPAAQASAPPPPAEQAAPVVQAAPPPVETTPAADDSLDDYFNRLDAAFASLSTPAFTGPTAANGDPEDLSKALPVPTIDDLLSAPPVDDRPLAPPLSSRPPAGPTRQPGARALDASSRTVIADAFSALFAVEQGEPGAMPVRLTPAEPRPVVTDELVAEITERVLQRLAPDAARDVVARVVSEVAERLVREEIARIKAKAE